MLLMFHVLIFYVGLLGSTEAQPVCDIHRRGVQVYRQEAVPLYDDVRVQR